MKDTVPAFSMALSLDVPESQTFEEWTELGRKLCDGAKVVNWYIGDWWAAGQHRYGERAKAAAEGIFGREFSTLANAASVCRAFESSRRREALPWSHHVEVAALSPADADAILDDAEAGKLSKREVRTAVVKLRTSRGEYPIREDDDPEHTELLDIARRWNRARRSVREEFLDLANEADLGEIDP